MVRVVGLVAVFGGGVAEADVLGDVIRREMNRAPSGVAPGGERAVGVHGGDGPEFPVAYRFAVVGGELPVVAAGGDDVADVSALTTADAGAVAVVELAGAQAGGLDGGVDGVDVIVGRRGDRRAAFVGGHVEPGLGDPVEVPLECVGVDAVVGLVRLEGTRVAAAELQ